MKQYCVYLIAGEFLGEWCFKIGRSSNLKSRTKVWLKVGENVQLVAYIPCRTRRHSVVLEHTLCAALKPLRRGLLEREWFRWEKMVHDLFFLQEGVVSCF